MYAACQVLKLCMIMDGDKVQYPKLSIGVVYKLLQVIIIQLNINNGPRMIDLTPMCAAIYNILYVVQLSFLYIP